MGKRLESQGQVMPKKLESREGLVWADRRRNGPEKGRTKGRENGFKCGGIEGKRERERGS
jgi:hypothetical protein